MGDDTHRINRRAALKTLGGTALVSTVPTQVLGSEDADTRQDWQCYSDCPQEQMFIAQMPLNLNAPGGEGSVAAHWFESFEFGGTWYHDISVSGAASGYSPGGIMGQKYGVHPLCGLGRIDVSTNNADFGQYPPEGSSKFPGWTQAILDTVIGTLSTGAGWFLTVGNVLNNKLSNDSDGMDTEYHNIGFRYKNTNGYTDSWEQCCYGQRIRWETDFEDSYLEYYSGFGESQTPWPFPSTEFKQLKSTIYFDGKESDVWPGDPTSTATTVAPETAFSDPHSLTDRELAQFGIERVPDHASITRTVGGTEVTPEFIATSCPLTVGFNGAQRVEERADGNVVSRTEIETENIETIK